MDSDAVKTLTELFNSKFANSEKQLEELKTQNAELQTQNSEVLKKIDGLDKLRTDLDEMDGKLDKHDVNILKNSSGLLKQGKEIEDIQKRLVALEKASRGTSAEIAPTGIALETAHAKHLAASKSYFEQVKFLKEKGRIKITFLDTGMWADATGNPDEARIAEALNSDFRFVSGLRRARGARGSAQIALKKPNNFYGSLAEWTQKILAGRRAYRGKFSVQCAVPAEAEALENLLMAYKRESVVFRFDLTLGGTFVIIVNDGRTELRNAYEQAAKPGFDARSEKDAWEKTCTKIFVDNPMALLETNKLSIDDFKKLSEKILIGPREYPKWFLHHGKMLERPPPRVIPPATAEPTQPTDQVNPTEPQSTSLSEANSEKSPRNITWGGQDFRYVEGGLSSSGTVRRRTTWQITCFFTP